MTSMTPFISQDRIVKHNYVPMENLDIQGHILAPPFQKLLLGFCSSQPPLLKIVCMRPQQAPHFIERHSLTPQNSVTPQ